MKLGEKATLDITRYGSHILVSEERLTYYEVTSPMATGKTLI